MHIKVHVSYKLLTWYPYLGITVKASLSFDLYPLFFLIFPFLMHHFVILEAFVLPRPPSLQNHSQNGRWMSIAVALQCCKRFVIELNSWINFIELNSWLVAPNAIEHGYKHTLDSTTLYFILISDEQTQIGLGGPCRTL